MILWRICTSNLVLIYYIIRYKRGFHLLAHSIKEFARFQSKSILWSSKSFIYTHKTPFLYSILKRTSPYFCGVYHLPPVPRACVFQQSDVPNTFVLVYTFPLYLISVFITELQQATLIIICAKSNRLFQHKRFFRIKSYFFAGCRYHLLLFSIGESFEVAGYSCRIALWML